MSQEKGEPEMLTFRELARRLVADGVVPHITHQRISQIRREDPEAFPRTTPIGGAMAVDYREARPYFEQRQIRPGRRTDLGK